MRKSGKGGWNVAGGGGGRGETPYLSQDSFPFSFARSLQEEASSREPLWREPSFFAKLELLLPSILTPPAKAAPTKEEVVEEGGEGGGK